MRNLAITTAAVLLLVASPAAAKNLVKNGSFENPVQVEGGFALFSKGSSFTGWAVVGAAGNVGVASGGYTSSGVTFPSKKGNQWLDLTGNTNTQTGVVQTIKTKPGATYSIEFWIGNVVNPTGPFGTSSTVDLQIDGAAAGTFTYSGGGTTLTWKKFTKQFTASASHTTIGFINKDPANDSSNGLDVVTVTALPPG